MVSISTTSLMIKQRPPSIIGEAAFLKEYDFFVFTLSSEELLKIAKFLGRKESSLGIQREHKEDRDKEIGSFITSDHPFFPNTIIVNIPLEYKESYYDPQSQKLAIDVPEGSAYILDGQHRLKAFESKYSNQVHLPLVVTAYFNLEIPTMAEIFTRINFFQKPVTKSLVYDLLEHNPDPAFDKYRVAHEVTQKLNSRISSPFYGKIKMLGIGSGIISQAAVVEALSTRYKIIEHMGVNDPDIILERVSNFFASIQSSFQASFESQDPKEKLNPNFFFKSIGFNAAANILGEILQKDKDADADFKPYANIMAQTNISDQSVGPFGGLKGVGDLVNIFRRELKKAGLL